MIRKDWYRTIAIETKGGLDQLGLVREILAEYNVGITDFEVERPAGGSGIVLKVGVKLHTTKHNEQLLNDIGRLDGVGSVKWLAD
jgi:hypothetical protein